MNLIKMFLDELESEKIATIRMLERVPTEKLDWRPHPKSMTIRALSVHIAELPEWISMAMLTNELDFASNPYKPTHINEASDLIKIFEESLDKARMQLIPENENKLNESWILRNGEVVYMKYTKSGVIRHSLSQIIHHRAQLGVFLRLLDIPIPGPYGPSADEQGL